MQSDTAPETDLPDHPTIAALLRKPWARLQGPALGKARRVPTMLSPDEQRLYYWLTAFWAEGVGEVVDLGCFAGGSSARLAEGMEVAGYDRRLHAFDRFTAGEDVKQSVLYRQGVQAFDGDDILPLAKSLLAPWGERIVFRQGEIDRMDWSDGPIEILVMDASKAASTMDCMTRTFFPHLVPGRSLVVQQDFLHWSQPWVPVQMELLADCFRPLVHVPRDTLVFLCERTPTMEHLAVAQTAALSDEVMLGCLDLARQRYEDWGICERLDEMIEGLRANPGKRRAFQFRKP